MKLSMKNITRAPQNTRSRRLIFEQKKNRIARKIVNTPQYMFGSPSLAVGCKKATEFEIILPKASSTPERSAVEPMFTAKSAGNLLTEE